MLDRLRRADADEDGRELLRALDGLVEEDALDDDAWIDALANVDAWAGSAQHRRIDAELGRALRRWIVARSARPGFWARGLATIAIDVWRKTADCTPQYLCDFARRRTSLGGTARARRRRQGSPSAPSPIPTCIEGWISRSWRAR